MSVKTYQAKSMAEVLTKVKGDLGSNAVILHTRSFKRGGVMGLWKRNVVEVTASADQKLAAARKRAAASKPAEAGNILRNAYAKPPARQLNQASALVQSGGGAAVAATLTTRELVSAVLKEPAFELRNEIASLRTMVESLLQRTSRIGGARKDLPEQLAKLYAQLIEQQVSDEIAARVVDDVMSELSEGELSNAGTVRERLTQKLSALVPIGDKSGVSRATVGGACRTICLIGPTGVGKTTTIAKLAAAFKLRQKQKVGLITIDTYRIAAVDQLRTYANIIGVPLKVVLTPQELAAAMNDMADCDTILVDTAGRSPSDSLKLNELTAFVQAGNFTEVHLVLSSTTTQAAMEAALAQFGRVRVDQIIFTKLDEAVSFGVLLNVARKASKALSYITTGQDVPDHVELGQPRRLAKLILGEKL
jgi:flagellar biosynthesis protein FlhF